jgi:hypothetical protein
MKGFLRGILVLAFTALPTCALAQHYTETTAVRITKLRILPGKTDDFYQAFHWSIKCWDAEKAAGLILGYSIYRSLSYEGPDKYDIKFALVFKNLAALDGFAEKAEPILASVYGSPENRAVIAKLRTDSSEVVSSELQRGIELTGK